MRDVYIIGSDTLKFGNYLKVSHIEMTRQTIEACLADAKLTPKDIESVHFGNGLWGHTHGQDGIRGQLAMRKIGIDTIPITNHEAACATGSLCLHSAYKDILTGLFECSLAIGVEKVIQEDKKKMMDSFGVYLDTANREQVFRNYDDWAKTFTKIQVPETDQKKQRSPFMDVYGYYCRWHMDRYGTTQEQLAMAASKNHWHSSMNPKAQYQFELSVEQILSDYLVSWPLTRSMCAPVGDGAASAIVCSEDFLRRLPREVQKRAIKIRASIYMSGDDRTLDQQPTTGRIAADKAYNRAGLGPDDIDVAEVHDATIIGEILQLENMGFCPVGEGGRFTAAGATKLGGKIPTNTSGGLVSRGHPVSASGLGLIYELVTQLRGEADKRQVENARIALGENGGGMLGFKEAAIAVHILEGRGSLKKAFGV